MKQSNTGLVVGTTLILLGAATFVLFKYVNPAPPNRIVISTSEDEGDYQTYAKLYQDIIKSDGVTLELRPSSGSVENLRRLQDPNSGVDVAFAQDGVGSAEQAPDLESLGSLYYEPIWIFYRDKSQLSRFSQLKGKRIAVGRPGGGTRTLTRKLLSESGIDESNSKLVDIGWNEAANSLKAGKVDAAFFMATPGDSLIETLLADKDLRLMSLEQAEAITRHITYLHHLVLPEGSIDLKRNLPAHDVDMVSPTATLVVRDSLHPALVYLLLKAASRVHTDPGIFEKKNEFPADKDDTFPLSDEAEHFYKTGAPFWQRHLPFWLANLVDRFLIFVVPLAALLIPGLKLIPRFLDWRVRSRIYQRYGELKYLETQLEPEKSAAKYKEYLQRLNAIEKRVDHGKFPIAVQNDIYVLRQHIDFVRSRLQQLIASSS